MSLVRINWHPTTRQLRQFGVVAAAAIPFLLWFWGVGGAWRTAGWSVAAASLVLAVVRPMWLRPLFIALSAVAAPIGLVLSEVVLAVIYFLVIWPIGLMMRLISGDPLSRRLRPEAETYWESRRQPASATEYYRQF